MVTNILTDPHILHLRDKIETMGFLFTDLNQCFLPGCVLTEFLIFSGVAQIPMILLFIGLPIEI